MKDRLLRKYKQANKNYNRCLITKDYYKCFYWLSVHEKLGTKLFGDLAYKNFYLKYNKKFTWPKPYPILFSCKELMTLIPQIYGISKYKILFKGFDRINGEIFRKKYRIYKRKDKGYIGKHARNHSKF